jgi:hypothetical protein
MSSSREPAVWLSLCLSLWLPVSLLSVSLPRSLHSLLCNARVQRILSSGNKQTTRQTNSQNNQTNGEVSLRLLLTLPCLMPRSHQPFRPVLALKLVGITLRNRCWPTAFHTITAGDVDGRCRNWPVWSTPHTNLFVPFWPWKCWGLRWGIDVGPPRSTLLQPEMSTDGVRIGQCDQHLTPNFPSPSGCESVGDYYVEE